MDYIISHLAMYNIYMKHCLEILANRYPQLLLPCKEGISKSEEYKNICLRGEECIYPLTFSKNPDDFLETVETPAGSVDVLSLRDRQDFVHACRCLGHKCEPVEIPDSTGAMALFGLNNWEKVRAGLDNYKDNFIILSSGNYSNVSNLDIYKETDGQINLSEQDWINKSITIRKYHELTHFVMRKTYPDDISFIRDELIADAIGLISVFGYFDTRLIKLFLGIESNIYREGGRLQNYEGGNIENIPNVLKMIDELKNKIIKYENSDIDTIWKNIKELM